MDWDHERKLTDEIDDLLAGADFPDALKKMLWCRRYNIALDELNGIMERLLDVRRNLVEIIEEQRRIYNSDVVPYFSNLKEIPVKIDPNHDGPWDYEENP